MGYQVFGFEDIINAMKPAPPGMNKSWRVQREEKVQVLQRFRSAAGGGRGWRAADCLQELQIR